MEAPTRRCFGHGTRPKLPRSLVERPQHSTPRPKVTKLSVPFVSSSFIADWRATSVARSMAYPIHAICPWLRYPFGTTLTVEYEDGLLRAP